jgi:hypothetical protein
MKPIRWFTGLLFCFLLSGFALGADIVPLVIEQPGTQKGEVGNLESPDRCDNCHGGYDKAVEPAFTWRGSAMANAGRDPLFWATVAIAEQDFDGSGDLCIRCHSTGGWYADRSTPTDGSGLAAGDADGVDCDACHTMTNPDNSELIGVQNPPYVANDGTEGYYGSGILALSGGTEKLGPYIDAAPKHKFKSSNFHRSVDYCGSCHDVSNPAVGNLAPNHGAQSTADFVVADGMLNGTVDTKAAFNNPPYMYGIVERTFSEYKAAQISKTLVSEYQNLPVELQGGALKAAYERALTAGTGGNFEDGTPRYFSCQTCHMIPSTGTGADKSGILVRKDLAVHDMTGGNFWLADVIKYQEAKDQLVFGGGLTSLQVEALDAGALRAKKQLSLAVSLQINGNTLKVINQTGHKVISGYPEGRRMWLRITCLDRNGTVLRLDGEYGPLTDNDGNPVMARDPAGGVDIQVQSILDVDSPDTRIYNAHYAMTKAWAEKLMIVNAELYGPIVLKYDRITGAAKNTIGSLAGGDDPYHETLHFVLNNYVSGDNRIPPYGMNYEEARRRNVLPVPAEQYGNPEPSGTYNHWDEMTLNPPLNAARAQIEMLYQSTSWEYIQFLEKANTGQNAFLGKEGSKMLESWLHTGMAPPYIMASAEWVGISFPTTYLLNVTMSGNGTVTSSPAGIDCGNICSSEFQEDSVVTILAVSETNSFFKGWSDGSCGSNESCSVYMDEAKTLTATFGLKGDINDDDTVDLFDLILALQILSGLNAPAYLQADTNGDSRVDMADAVYLLQIIGGK